MGSATYSSLRENLAAVWDEVESTQEPVIVKRRGHQSMAILPADELESLLETAHLLRSPKNAQRLLEALHDAVAGRGQRIELAALRDQLGVEAEKGE